MESLTTGFQSDQFSRRHVLQLAAASGLGFLLPGMDLRAAEKRGKERPKSLIVLWLAGGPSQLETWDPHPGTKIGGPTKSIKTKVPGLEIADLFPRVAEQIHELSVIRSMVSKEGDHERGSYYLKTGYRPDPTVLHPSLGAILAHELPAAGLEIPKHIAIGESNIQTRGGYLGDEFDPFRVFNPVEKLRNLEASVKVPRRDKRLTNLEVVESSFRIRRKKQSARTLHRETIDRALKMMTSEQLNAFKYDKEPAELKAAYGDTPFGVGCLLARRLVETGVPTVEVNLNGFDYHLNNFNGHEAKAKILDPAFATLISDLKSRDLLDSTVVVCMGEFGRTTSISPLDGRQHWPSGFSVVLGGGGLTAGQVIGATDPTGVQKVPDNPVSVEDLYATILGATGVNFGREIITPVGRPLKLCPGKPIPKLLQQS